MANMKPICYRPLSIPPGASRAMVQDFLSVLIKKSEALPGVALPCSATSSSGTTPLYIHEYVEESSGSVIRFSR